MHGKPKISVVIPVYNEAQNIAELYSRIRLAEPEAEIIMVDDGSSDSSSLEVAQLHKKDPDVKLISLSRNFGHMIALSAGLDFAEGDAVVMMDADLQHPPELIPELVKRWEAGADVVNTIRKDSRSVGFFKRLTAGFFYGLLNKIARINLPANAADFRLLDKNVVLALSGMKERSRFLRGLISWVGFKQEFVEYQAQERFSGRTKYSLAKMLSFAVDGITSFSAFPLRLAAYLGLLMSFFSFLYIVYAVYIKFFTDEAIAGWTSVLVAVLLIGSVQLVFLGVIGEYLSRVFEETKERPLYIINKKIGF